MKTNLSEILHIAYLDFECELPKIDDRCERCQTVRCKCDTSFTRFETEKKPICFPFFYY